QRLDTLHLASRELPDPIHGRLTTMRGPIMAMARRYLMDTERRGSHPIPHLPPLRPGPICISFISSGIYGRELGFPHPLYLLRAIPLAAGVARSAAATAPSLRSPGDPRQPACDDGRSRRGKIRRARDTSGRDGFGGGRKAPPPNQTRHGVAAARSSDVCAWEFETVGGGAGDRWEAAARAMRGGAKEWET
uniref:Uncharacterized protein n=1 Tax=Aegilops tauschii subsp. strangulata TaxID=200361 RepID=A0A452ZBE0_AEGTS